MFLAIVTTSVTFQILD